MLKCAARASSEANHRLSAYLIAKALHLACAATSIAGFVARGTLMLRGSALLQVRFVRVAPHVVDTVLLASALWLLWLLELSPFANGWVAAKIVALILYIVFGSVALRRGRSLRVRAAAFALALASAAYIVAVALTRDPLGPLALL